MIRTEVTTILLRYVMDRDMAIIPKSVKPARVVENFQLFDFKLSKDEIKLLESTKNRQRLFTDDLRQSGYDISTCPPVYLDDPLNR
ncbi:hypothetical protein TELCIR_10528 [Teladorsagia circumcincta]|uniref:NADP-dependent oxidoreductase domain-containing protein n=1 Tax=Teladorsagia circumcincta TaxID=45464 RepID=A0A2G9UBW5_TELCI|nr:hypothetical protein TELCIR_10528 [Teladorsagia circumcincta]